MKEQYTLTQFWWVKYKSEVRLTTQLGSQNRILHIRTLKGQTRGHIILLGNNLLKNKYLHKNQWRAQYQLSLWCLLPMSPLDTYKLYSPSSRVTTYDPSWTGSTDSLRILFLGACSLRKTWASQAKTCNGTHSSAGVTLHTWSVAVWSFEFSSCLILRSLGYCI